MKTKASEVNVERMVTGMLVNKTASYKRPVRLSDAVAKTGAQLHGLLEAVAVTDDVEVIEQTLHYAETVLKSLQAQVSAVKLIRSVSK